MTSEIAPIQAEKQALRSRMLGLRAGVDADLVASLRTHVAIRPGEIVAGIWPLPGEADLRAVWHALHAAGHRVVLPQTPARGEALRFRPWSPGCAMREGRFGTRYPVTLDELSPELLFVPLLAFDRWGFRLGYGGGYYDRTLAALPMARAVGYGFACQQVEAVPRGPHDVALSEIVTETGPVAIER